MALFNRKKKSEEKATATMDAVAQQPTTASGMPITPSVASTMTYNYNSYQNGYDVQNYASCQKMYSGADATSEVPSKEAYSDAMRSSDASAYAAYQNGYATQYYYPYAGYSYDTAASAYSANYGAMPAEGYDTQAASASRAYTYGMSPATGTAGVAGVAGLTGVTAAADTASGTTSATSSYIPYAASTTYSSAVDPAAASSASNYAASTAAAAAKAAATAKAGYNYTAPTEDEMQVTAALTSNHMPAADSLRDELSRTSQKRRFKTAWRNALFAIIAVAAVSVLVSMLFMPVLRIYGSSMTPTLREGNIALAVKANSLEPGEVVAFYYNNRVLVKRVIAGPGSWVDITDDGVVTVNGQKLDEPYVSELALGECNIELPYQVPDNRYFVMGDHRATSVDSRSTTIGCVSTDQMVGCVIATIWPLNEFGLVS